jgi:hypothetical protein
MHLDRIKLVSKTGIISSCTFWNIMGLTYDTNVKCYTYHFLCPLCHFALFFTIWTPLLQIKLAILWSYWKLLVTCLQENIWRLLWNIVLHTLVHSSQNDQITHKICITLFFVMFVALLFALKNYLLNCSWCELWSFMIFSFDFFKGKFFTIQISNWSGTNDLLQLSRGDLNSAPWGYKAKLLALSYHLKVLLSN